MPTRARKSCEKEATTNDRQWKHHSGSAMKNDDRSFTFWRLGLLSMIPPSSLSWSGYMPTPFSKDKKLLASKSEEKTVEIYSASTLTRSILHVVKAATAQARGLTHEFKTSGLPWNGPECRSLVSGVSGILYCFPALCCNGNRFEQIVWTLQAVLSILADYVYIGGESWIHGIDRIFATTNAATLALRGAMSLNFVFTVVATSVPISTFILANRAKQQLDLKGWIFYHFMWHITSSVAVTMSVYLLYACNKYREGGDDSIPISLMSINLCK